MFAGCNKLATCKKKNHFSVNYAKELYNLAHEKRKNQNAIVSQYGPTLISSVTLILEGERETETYSARQKKEK